MPNLTQPLTDCTISQLAAIIEQDWKPVSPYAKPYVTAMRSLNNINDNYYADTGVSVVLYFLSNAAAWRGEVAKSVKAELRRRCK